MSHCPFWYLPRRPHKFMENYQERRRNPRVKKFFPLTLFLGKLSFRGRAVEPSAYGANVEVTEYEFNQLKDNPPLWENNRRIAVSTQLNEIPACINNLKISEGRHLVSIKLLDGRTWYK